VANTAQARKRVRQAEKSRQRNASQRSMMRTMVKRVFAAIASGDKSAAETAYKEAVPGPLASIVWSAPPVSLEHNHVVAMNQLGLRAIPE